MAISNFISAVWSENLIQNLDRQYVGILNCNREFEGDIKGCGSVVNILGVNDVTISDYVLDEDMDMPEGIDSYYHELEIDQAKCFNFQLDDIDKAQGSPKLMDHAMKAAAASLAREAEKHVYSLWSQSNIITRVEDVTEDSIVDKIIELKTRMLEGGTVNDNEIVFEVTPKVAELILKAKIDLGKDDTALEAGLLGKVAGCKVYVSNNVAVNEGYHQCIMRTKRAVAFAEQISEVEAYRPEKRFADAVKGLHLYGAKVVYPSEFMVLSLKMN